MEGSGNTRVMLPTLLLTGSSALKLMINNLLGKKKDGRRQEKPRIPPGASEPGETATNWGLPHSNRGFQKPFTSWHTEIQNRELDHVFQTFKIQSYHHFFPTGDLFLFISPNIKVSFYMSHRHES